MNYTALFKISIKKLDVIILFIMSISSVIVGMAGNKTFLLWELCLLFFVILYKAKFSFFSAFSFILLFSYLQEHIAALNQNLAGGMLYAGLGVPVYIIELYICTSFFFVMEYIFFSFSKILGNEKKMYTTKIVLSKRIAYLFAVSAFGLIILSYPTLPTLSGTLARNEGVIQSSRFVQVAMLLLAITFDSAKKEKMLYVIWVISLVWILFHGDRVIVFGFLIYCAFKYLNTQSGLSNKVKNKIVEHKKIIFVGIAGLLVAALGIRLQLSRSGYSTANLNLSTVFRNILVQGTACDVVYVFNCATDMWKHGNLLNGYTFLQYIVCWIPFLPNPYYPAAVIMKYYTTLGGGLFFAEPMMNVGLIGTCVFSFLFLMFLNIVLNKPSNYKCFFWIPFILTIFRMTWYLGLDSWVTMSIYITPILYYIAKRFR